MARARARDVCSAAKACVAMSPPIPYVLGGESLTGQDCQGHVEYCVRKHGGDMRYAGSNDMFRNACEWVGTLAEARAQGKLLPGALLFLVTQTGTYPEKYHADGKGNASHVGLYIGDADIEITHASASAGCVTASTMRSTWTHVGLAKAIDYTSIQEGGGQMNIAVVTAQQGGTVNLRASASRDSVALRRVPVGTRVTVENRTGGYARLFYDGATGYMQEEFLQYVSTENEGPSNKALDHEKAMAAYRLLGEALGVAD